MPLKKQPPHFWIRSPARHTNEHRRLTHDAVCAVGGGRARGGAVVIGPAPAPSSSVETGHGRKAGGDVCRRVRGVALRRDGQREMKKNKAKQERSHENRIKFKLSANDSTFPGVVILSNKD